MILDSVLYCGACALYLVAGGLTLRALRSPGSRIPVAMRPILALAVALHAAVLARDFVVGEALGIAMSLSVAFALAVVVLWVSAGLSRVFTPLGVLLPGAAVAVWLPAMWPGVPLPAGVGLAGRCGVALTLVALSLMLIAVFFAGLGWVADRKLRAGGADFGEAGGVIDSLPGLLIVEKILFYVLCTGFAVLTAALVFAAATVTGWDGGVFGMDARLAALVLSWAVFAVVLAGRLFAGWRGKTVGSGVLVGFCLMVVAMLGRTLVQGG